MAWYHRLLNVGRTERLNREIDREQAFHIAEKADALRAAGLSEAEAEREARRLFGNPTFQRERTRDANVMTWLDSVARDTRHAARALGRAPVFAAVAVLSLGLGIGANAAIFTLIEAVVLRPLPVASPEELVVIGMAREETPGPAFTNPLWEELRDRQSGMTAVAAFGGGRFNTAAGGEPRRLNGSWVSGDYFRLFGVGAAVGRVLTERDDVRGCAPVAVLGHGLWQAEYGSDPGVVGRTLRLEGIAFEIIGVARRGFHGPEVGRESQVFVPICAQAVVSGDGAVLDHRSRWWLQVMGRREAGVSLEQLNARLAAIAPGVYEATVPPQYGQEGQARYRENTITATEASTGLSGVRERYREALLLLMGGVGLVLLIACANVANLLLARATARERELAIRAAIGAGRGRLSRQMLTESLLLALLGAVLGLVVARFGAPALVGLIGADSAVTLDLSLNAPVLAFTTGVAVLTVLVFGFVPAWRAARVDPQTAMTAHGRGIAEGHGGFTLGKVLVAAQVALSLTLLAGAGLLVGSLRNLTAMDPGFTAEGVLVAEIDARRAELSPEQARVVKREMLEGLRALPGVRGASASALTPIGNMRWNDALIVDGLAPAGEQDDVAWFNEVSPGYFETMETRFLGGRDFDDSDVAGGPRVAIVNETVARKFFGGDPLGETFRLPMGDSASEPYTVVGVVEDARYMSLREEESPTVYLAASQAGDGPPWTSFEIRTDGDPRALIPAVKALTARAHPAISIEFGTLSEQLADSLARERMLAALSTLFASMALALAMLGLYGIMAYSVTRRRNEIGVRIALGAARARVVRMILADTALVLGIGLAVGTAGAIASGRLVTAYLYELSPADPAVLGGAVALLTLVALAAGAIPAWRAARMDPTVALREE